MKSTVEAQSRARTASAKLAPQDDLRMVPPAEGAALPSPAGAGSQPRRVFNPNRLAVVSAPSMIVLVATVLLALLLSTMTVHDGSSDTDAVAEVEAEIERAGRRQGEVGRGARRGVVGVEGASGEPSPVEPVLVVDLGDDSSTALADSGSGTQPEAVLQTDDSSDPAENVPDNGSSVATARNGQVASAVTRATSTTQAKTTAATQPPPSPTTVVATTLGGGAVIWEDHFNTLDTSRWQVEHSTYGDGNRELQCYQPGNVAVSQGRLILTARSESVTCPKDRQRSVSSGMVRSTGVTFWPGQAIEFRVKLTPDNPDDQGGLWPAVWSSSWAGGPWPRGGELDFLEVMTAEDPKRSVYSMHYANPSGSHELKNKAVPMGSYFSDAWHVIRFEYGHNGKLRWFLDGQQVFAVDHANTVQGYPAPFNQPIHQIKINLAVGGKPGGLAPGALGQGGATFEVDYIRLVQL